MIRPLRRYHRGLIAGIIVTLTVATLLAIAYPAPDVRMERLPASLLPADSAGAAGSAQPTEGAARRAAPARGAVR